MTLARGSFQASPTRGARRFIVVAGSNVSAILYENENGWRVSMRTLTPNVDVAAIAAAFGGGGHPKAAGVQIDGGIAERDEFLRRAADLASEQAAS